jgi:hypothetical protein
VAGRSPRFRLLAVSALSAVAACATPFGPSVWSYAVGLTTDPSVTGRISEWQRTLPTDVPGALFYASVVAVAALAFRRRSALTWPMALWLVVFAAIGVYAVRGIAWWALAFVPVASALIAAGASTTVRPDTASMRRVNAVIAVVLVLVGIALLPVWRPIDPGTGTPIGLVTDAPSGVTATLRTAGRPGDHVLNPQPWGSWFEFAVPNRLVAVDSRVELFPASVWTEYDDVRTGAPGWESILGRWGVTVAVVDDAEGDLARRLVTAGWTTTYAGDDGAVLTAPAR